MIKGKRRRMEAGDNCQCSAVKMAWSCRDGKLFVPLKPRQLPAFFAQQQLSPSSEKNGKLIGFCYETNNFALLEENN
jgi:hypothetical protein